MKDLIRKCLTVINSAHSLGRGFQPGQGVLLFDSSQAAEEVAFMFKGQWDTCNGVALPNLDEVAINTAASLVGAQWCYSGAAVTLLLRLPVDELLNRYAAGERNFSNANLRGAKLQELYLPKVNLSWAKLTGADLQQANLSQASFSEADLSQANLSEANLNQADLVRANLTGGNLGLASLIGADLYRATLREVNLCDAKLSGANLRLADLRGAELDGVDLTGANLQGAQFIAADLARAIMDGTSAKAIRKNGGN